MIYWEERSGKKWQVWLRLKDKQELSKWRVGGRASQAEETKWKSLRWKEPGFFPSTAQWGWTIVKKVQRGMGWNWKEGGLPWWSSGSDLALPLQGTQVQSLVGELISYMTSSAAKKKKKKWKKEIGRVSRGLVTGHTEFHRPCNQVS